MTQAQHTQAPWDVRAQWDGHGVDYYLLNPELDEKPMAEIYANARLIAAAPELLEQLEGYVDAAENQLGCWNFRNEMDDNAITEMKQSIAESRALIAKAKGGAA